MSGPVPTRLRPPISPAPRRLAARAAVSQVPPIVHESLRSGGQALDAATRAAMESRLGHDFSRVRVHTDSRAARAADALDARAFTLGRDVVFGQGSWAPRTDAGLELLAHELTHVVQGPHDAVQRQTRSGVETGHLERNRFNVLPTGALTPIGDADPGFKYQEGKSNSYRDEAGLVWQLEPDWKTSYHQPPGHEKSTNPYPNKKFLHPDSSGGSSEAIRRPDGTYITTGPLRGTYNFVHPKSWHEGYVGHFVRDVLPHELRSQAVKHTFPMPGLDPNPYTEFPPLDPRKVDVDTYRQRYEAQIGPIGERSETNVTDPMDRRIVIETGVVWITHSSGEILVLAQAINGRLSFLRFIDNELRDEAIAQGQARQPRGIQRIPGSPPYIFGVPAAVPANAAHR